MRVVFLFALLFALLAMVAAGKHKGADEAGEAVVKVKSHKKKCSKAAAASEAGVAMRRALLGKKHAMAEADGEAVVKVKVSCAAWAREGKENWEG
jgi:hypothetical protein